MLIKPVYPKITASDSNIILYRHTLYINKFDIDEIGNLGNNLSKNLYEGYFGNTLRVDPVLNILTREDYIAKNKVRLQKYVDDYNKDLQKINIDIKEIQHYITEDQYYYNLYKDTQDLKMLEDDKNYLQYLQNQKTNTEESIKNIKESFDKINEAIGLYTYD